MRTFLNILIISLFFFLLSQAIANALTPDDVKLSPDDVKLPICMSLELPFNDYLKGLSPDDVKQDNEDRVGLSPDDVKQEAFEALERETYEGVNAYFLQTNHRELLFLITETIDGEEHVLAVIDGREVLSESAVEILLAIYENLMEMNPEFNEFPVIKITLSPDSETGDLFTTVLFR